MKFAQNPAAAPYAYHLVAGLRVAFGGYLAVSPTSTHALSSKKTTHKPAQKQNAKLC
jgi:hypothetical protein